MRAHPSEGWNPGRWHIRVRLGPLAVVTSVTLLLATTASAGASFGDTAGDANDAPDVASVSVSDASGTGVTIRVALRNFQALPTDARIDVRLDLDRDAGTGASGAELVVEYAGDGTTAPSRW